MAKKRYAVVVDGRVVNRIVVDEGSVKAGWRPVRGELIPCDGMSEIGGTWDGTRFSPAVRDPLVGIRRRAIEQLEAAYKHHAFSLAMGAKSFEEVRQVAHKALDQVKASRSKSEVRRILAVALYDMSPEEKPVSIEDLEDETTS